MNKKLIALAMVLLLAVGGLFAVADLPPGTGNVPVTATLKADWLAYLNHGFISGLGGGDFNYQATKTILDAFTTDPVFYYGYKTNATGNFQFRMTVSDFTSTIGETTSTVKISGVKKGASTLEKTVNGLDSYYILFTRDNSSFVLGSAAVYEEAQITISPAKAVGVGITSAQHVGEGSTAPAGSYTSTVTISVVSLS